MQQENLHINELFLFGQIPNGFVRKDIEKFPIAVPFPEKHIPTRFSGREYSERFRDSDRILLAINNRR